MDIIWSPNSRKHLRDIVFYIGKDNPVAAQSVKDTIEKIVEHLKTSPNIGKPGRVSDTRELVIPAYSNYILVYEVKELLINILAVRYSARKWPKKF